MVRVFRTGSKPNPGQAMAPSRRHDRTSNGTHACPARSVASCPRTLLACSMRQMIAVLAIAEVDATSSWMPVMVALFESYRGHYGQPMNLVESRDWLNSQLASGGLRGYLARRDGEPAGMALVASTAASLRLGHSWQLRDLYVAERHRRQGVGHALVAHVRDAAVADGALRLSLTTEADNVRALALYRDLGFKPVSGYTSLSLQTEISS